MVVLLPRFFKVFLSATDSESMEIHVWYMQHLESPLPRKAKLLGTGGKTWTVRMKIIRERVFFTEGWSNFAEDHSLVDGEYLTFVYDSHHTFEVSVYDRSTCKETRAVEEEEDTSMNVVDCDNSKCIVPVGSEEAQTEFPVDAESTNVDVINDSPYYIKEKDYTIYNSKPTLRSK
ncbi:unnamed protein product [Cochlearia groenlandica]